tara:strand:- start:2947 stop:3354 length:408 start_codon:yes stop_codon:yes gene_type:complete
MSKAPEIEQMKRFANYLFTFLCFSVIFCNSAFAQVSESDIGSETGFNDSISRLTSTFEVKRAVIGLLIIAAISVILFFFYWYKTAQLAKENYFNDLQSTMTLTSTTKQQNNKVSWAVSEANTKRENKPFRLWRKN